LLGVIARDRLGDPGAAGCALQRALDLAEPDRAPCPFLIHPPTRLPDRQVRRRSTYAALISETSELAARADRLAPPPGQQAHHFEALSHSEIRVLRYLPTNLSAPEIARELSVSVTTVRTHISHLFVKLDAHRRTEAVARARDLGLLAPSPVRRAGQPRATVLCPGPRCLA
jgi:LuxR family maltose regulon positive regulatory protein